MISKILPSPTSDHLEDNTEAAVLTEPAALTEAAGVIEPAAALTDPTAATREPAALSSEIEDILGREGLQDQPKGISLHPRIETRWAAILMSGLSEESRQSMQKKYTLPENCPLLTPPKLNEEVAATMNESGLKRDKRLAEKQMSLGTAASCIGQVLNTMLENDSCCLKQIETLNDAARIICSIIQSDSVTRRTLILPGLNKDMKALMEKTEISEFLFGDKLQDKVSACKAVKKSAQELKNTPSTQKKVLNYRGPPKQPPHLSGPKEKKTPRRPPLHRVQAPPIQRPRSPHKQPHQRRRPGPYRR